MTELGRELTNRLTVTIQTCEELAEAANKLDNLAWSADPGTFDRQLLKEAANYARQAIGKIAEAIQKPACSACSSGVCDFPGYWVYDTDGERVDGAWVCRKCQGVNARVSSKDALRLVKNGQAPAGCQQDGGQYFDIAIVENGVTVARQHGWFDPDSRAVIQYGTRTGG